MITAKTSKTLRGVAILIVIASHFAEWMFLEPAHPGLRHMIGTWGPPGVDIFLLLSGYGLYLSARKEAERTGAPGGITGHFVLRRLLNGILPYYLIIGIAYFFTGTWKQALQEGYLPDTLRAYLTATDHWYIQVLIVLYLAFILCFRFGGKFRLPLLAAAVILYTIRLANAGRIDFWTLSNGTFLIGICAAALETRFPEQIKLLCTRLAVLLAGAAGMAFTFLQMERLGGSGAQEAYGWELAMNLCFAVIVLGVAWLLKEPPCFLLPLLGQHSLFLYLIHTPVFWQLIFKLEALPYVAGAVLTAIVSILLSIAAGTVYSRIVKGLFRTAKQ